MVKHKALGDHEKIALAEKLRPFKEGKEPEGYNEKIFWLMVNDQMPEHVICSDKILCRAYVSGRIGEQYVREIFQIADSVDEISLEKLPDKFVAKASHDSGSVFVISEKAMWHKVKKKLKKKLSRTYGQNNGEWAYSFVVPRVLVEELMPGSIVDYKFHCCDGRIGWVQVIYDRESGIPWEANVDENYSPLGMHFDDNFLFRDKPLEIPNSWEEMTDIAKRLSRGFRYVRVDLYEYKNKPSFGEMTFWPRAGEYATKDEKKFGEFLKIDTSYTRPIIYDYFGYVGSGKEYDLRSRFRLKSR